MRLTFYFIPFICFILALGSVAAQQSRFDEANSNLEKGEFREAIEIYRAIADSGYYSGSLWLNLGVVSTRIDSLGLAKYYFLRAEMYPETEDRARRALDLINDRFPRQSAVLPPLPWNRFTQFLADSIGTTWLALLGLLFLYGGVAFIIGSWFRIDLKKLLWRSGTTSLAVSALLFLLAVIVQYQEAHYDTGVMIQNETSVYEKPSEESVTVSTAYEGYTMKVDREKSAEQEGWTYVRLEHGMYGWIRNNQIRTF